VPQTVYDFFNKKGYEMFDYRGNNLGKTWHKLPGIMETFFVPKELAASVPKKN